MENLRNKTEYIFNQQCAKAYFDRFLHMSIYSYTKPNDNKIYIGAKLTEVYSLFNGNTNSTKKTFSKEFPDYTHPDDVVIDQSALQYYLILGLQDFYHNYYLPLEEENKTLKDNLNMMQTMLINYKKKNDEKFEVLTKHLEILAEQINLLKKIN